METIEVVVFMGIAMLIAGMMVLFLINFDFASVQTTFSKILLPQQDMPSNVQKVSLSKAIQIINSCWNNCSFGEIDYYCGAMLIQENDYNVKKNIVNKTDFEEIFEKYNYCTSCNIEMDGNLNIPGVISADCNSGKIIISH